MEERKQMKFERLISLYFSNFPKIILLNLIFLLPSAVFTGGIYALSQLVFKGQNIFLLFISIVFIFPFYSGIVLVTRNIAREDKGIKLFSEYFSALKENFLHFIVHGLILYLSVTISYLGITFYLSLAQKVSWMFYIMLIIIIILSLLVLFSFFYIPLMSVTYDISMKNVYKNSFLMSFGEIKNNFKALLAVIVVLAVYGTVIILCYTNITLFMISIAVMAGLFIPSSVAYVVNFFIYDDMNSLISHKEERRQELKERIANGGKEVKKKAPDISDDDFSDIDISTLNNPDEYIYYKGKMVKQSLIIEKLSKKDTEE